MVIIDTGVIVAAAVPKDTFNKQCKALLTELRNENELLLLPATVAAEVGYMLSTYAGPELEVAFLKSVANGVFQPVELLDEDYARMAELAEQYISFPLGTTDASLIAIAERLRINTIATVDRRHFTAVRPKHVSAFRLLPIVL